MFYIFIWSSIKRQPTRSEFIEYSKYLFLVVFALFIQSIVFIIIVFTVLFSIRNESLAGLIWGTEENPGYLSLFFYILLFFFVVIAFIIAFFLRRFALKQTTSKYQRIETIPYYASIKSQLPTKLLNNEYVNIEEFAGLPDVNQSPSVAFDMQVTPLRNITPNSILYQQTSQNE
eukprot:TRINITY_DN1628_c0_g3_i2.p1 TRINITY_DN1628_c0_g3~~TRINITY_DN1628_c0_g3_i2.p1  ORF type:complete len:174 (-),score=49.75 TRINITY_DN1628_c0_g3_i2:9-530(-)